MVSADALGSAITAPPTPPPTESPHSQRTLELAAQPATDDVETENVYTRKVRLREREWPSHLAFC
jgi:hypothetical protein